MSLASHLLNAFLSTLLLAGIGHWAIHRFAPNAPARFGAFMLAIGYAIARMSGETPAWMADARLPRTAGVAAALAILWYRWFRHRMPVDK
ncbi:hypothetical protein [Sphingomonas sp. S6]|jgi:hypothetical protein|uniref:hypothetical protein n=1 Tax=Sphingomonas sp. S6 TaxID=3368600 RepID=UPI000FABDA65|nr:hypothetical protein [uncultured Sphingomonas sp.]RTL14414.1 MAG: hypothetical protein EKK50_15730 [Sphingomonadaceae bacterium]